MRNANSIATRDQRFTAVTLAAALMVAIPAAANAAVFYWDGPDTSDSNADETGQGGNGQWKTTASPTNWYGGPGVANSVNDNVTWTNSTTNDAVFGGTAGTVTLESSPLTVRDINIASAGYVLEIRGGARTLNVSSFSGTGLASAVIRTEPTNSRDFTVATNSADDTPNFSGSIQDGTGSTPRLKVSGPGKLILSGANSYTGSTTVNSGGTLLVEGSLGNTAVTVSSGGTLGGSGSIAGAVGVTGTIAPGASAGVLTVTNNVTFNASGTLAVELNGLAAGTEYDQLVAGGNVTLNNASLNLTVGGTMPALSGGEVFYILNKTTAGAIGGLFSGLADDARIDALDGQSGVNWHITYDAIAGSSLDGGNDIAIYTVVPEPAVFGVLAAAFGFLGARRSRR